MRRVVVLAFVVAAVAGISAAALAATPSTKKLRTSIESAIFAQGSVHYVETATAKGLRQTTLADAATDRGIQRVTLHLGAKTGHFTVVVVNRILYLSGDRTALQSYFGFPAPAARKYANRWISVPHTNASYGTLAADVTLPSFVADHVAKRNASIVQGKIAGIPVIGLRGVTVVGKVSSTSIVYVRSAKNALPVRAKDISSQHGFKDDFEFGGWHETINIKAPNHAIPISKLG